MTHTAEIMALLKTVSTAAITGRLYKDHGMRMRAIANVAPLDPATCRFAGPAYTIRYIPQREDLNASTDLANPASLLLRATEEMQAGDVFVIDMQGNASVGALGDVLVTGLVAAGVAGVVADGGMRDTGETASMGLPIFCRGRAAPPGPVAIMPVGVQEPVSCGGVAIFPGDMVVGDEDGVVVIPAALVEDVVRKCIDKERQDLWTRALVAKGGGVRGRYPPDAKHAAMYREWLAAQKR